MADLARERDLQRSIFSRRPAPRRRFCGGIATIRSWWHKVAGLFGGCKKEEEPEGELSEGDSDEEEPKDKEVGKEQEEASKIS